MEPKQGELQLPFPELGGDQPLIPVRMLNEHVYCPRLAYLEWVQSEWADSYVCNRATAVRPWRWI